MDVFPAPRADARARLLHLAARLPVDVVTVLRDWPWTATLRTLHQRFQQERLAITAGSLTFMTLIALVPLLTVMLALFSAFPMFGRFQAALQQYFLQSLVPDTIARPVMQALLQFAAKASHLGGVGLAVLGVTALTLMITIDRTLNGIWRVPKPRPLGRRIVVYWAALTLGPLLLGASLSVTSYAVSASKGLVARLPEALGLALDLLQFGLLAAGTAGLFRLVPNTHVRWRHALAGGAFVAAGFEVAKAGLAWYVKTVPTYSAIYGAFATVPIMMLWVYLGWVIMLLGAVLAAYIPSLVHQVVRLPDRPGVTFALALAVLKPLAGAQAAGRPGLTAEALAAQLKVDPLQVASLLEHLQALDWCGKLEEEGDPRWVLLIAPESTPVAPLVDLLLLHDRQASRAFRHASGFKRMKLAEVLADLPPEVEEA